MIVILWSCFLCISFRGKQIEVQETAKDFKHVEVQRLKKKQNKTMSALPPALREDSKGRYVKNRENMPTVFWGMSQDCKDPNFSAKTANERKLEH